jgi:hypothetical protein
VDRFWRRKNMSSEHKSEVFKKILQERLDKYVLNHGSGKSWDTTSNTARGKAFTEFYVRDILCRLEPVDEDDVDLGLRCDGKDDLNVDCVLQSDETFYIFQSKFKGKGQRLTNDEFAGFFSVHERLLDSKLIAERKHLIYQMKPFRKFVRFVLFGLSSTIC